MDIERLLGEVYAGTPSTRAIGANHQSTGDRRGSAMRLLSVPPEGAS